MASCRALDIAERTKLIPKTFQLCRNIVQLIRSYILSNIYILYKITNHFLHLCIINILYRIAKLDRRIGSCTVLACNKWKSLFAECETALGFSGDASKDAFSAWSQLTSKSFKRKSNTERAKQPSPLRESVRRSSSLVGLSGRTVKVPVQLIPLERARAMTSGSSGSNMMLKHRSIIISGSSIAAAPDQDFQVAEKRLEISRPLNIDNSNTYCSSCPPGLSCRTSLSPYAPQADLSEGSPSSVGDVIDREESCCSEVDPRATDKNRSDLEETVSGLYNTKEAIRTYVDNVSNSVCTQHRGM